MEMAGLPLTAAHVNTISLSVCLGKHLASAVGVVGVVVVAGGNVGGSVGVVGGD